MKLSVANAGLSRLRLIVLYTSRLETVVAFYRAIGLPFAAEKHGDGPKHYALACDDVVLEIYPLGKRRGADGVTLGFGIASIDACLAALAVAGHQVRPKYSTEGVHVVASIIDPDGRQVRLVELG